MCPLTNHRANSHSIFDADTCSDTCANPFADTHGNDNSNFDHNCNTDPYTYFNSHTNTNAAHRARD